MASGRMMNSNGGSSKVTNLSTSWQQTISSCPAVFRSFLAGSISGTCSTIIFQPLDLVKTRLQASITSEGRPIGMISTFKSVVRTESVRHLWRGTGPSLARCVPGIGIYFASLHGIKSSLGIDKADMLENALIGGAARTVAGVLVLPFTVIKTRFESTEYGYKTISDALRSIYRSEGRRGLFSGMMPTLLRDVPYSGLYLMFYSKIKHSLPSSSWVEQYSPPVHFAAGMVAGMLASLFTQPADVLKTHAQLHPHRFSKLNDAVNHVYQNDGLRGFLRGIVPRTVKRTLVGALSWTVYEEIMRRMGLKTV